MYHTFRIQLALDIASAGGSSSRDVVALVRAIPGITIVPHGMHVQWFVHQEEPLVASLRDFPEGTVVWEVTFNHGSPFGDASYRCTLKTSAEDLKTPLTHCADGEPVRVEQPGEFKYDVRLADEDGRTISLEQAVLIVS